ncbi:DEAD/DEAH box helicase [Palleronia sediminis]|uniref:DEAD-box ATP-dependent RNA helicase RhpA n=1 Tax=Palleronia sediminis TaxID=2547833 RepID=A0A4R6AKT8_9RHOB|nr:DEAD/DEAH box helicase [Palleronia sediminis]TDL84227.1 DEAD/DEAH box helicase [Palleronia sediminis]
MTTFSDLKLGPKVLRAIEETGYETPTPIQAQAIPAALEGRDILGIAQTGTGKTASFTLPMISLLARGRAKARMPRSLVLAPTRELAAQVAANFDTYAKHVKLTKALLIGGVSFKEQDQLIDKGVDVLIATPGRLLDHFERGKLLLTDVKIMVVDEADRMLDMGFIPDIERIFSLVPFTRQTLFFSATMAAEIERITNTFLSNPHRVEVARQATASESIDQFVVPFEPSRRDRAASEKRAALRAVLDGEGDKLTNGIIFCNRKIDVDAVSKSLKKHGYDAAPIHGDLDQSQRTATLDQFRAGDLKILVASDVAARGLDVPSVSHVFNFDVPSHAEDYVHRIGRTGRAGRDGKAITICSTADERNLEDVEALLEKTIPRMALPGKTPVPSADTAPAADAPEADAEAPKPRARRTRSRAKPATDEAAPATTAETAPSEAPAPQAAPEVEAVDADHDTPRVETTEREPRSRGRGGRSSRKPAEDSQATAPVRDDTRRDDTRRDDRGRGKPVVGMGDHMPTFIEKSFEERMTG